MFLLFLFVLLFQLFLSDFFQKKARKSAQNYANDFFSLSCVLIFHILFMTCRERAGMKQQKHTLLSLIEKFSNNIAQVIRILHLFFQIFQ